MLLWIFVPLFATAAADGFSISNQVEVRSKRQSVTVYYLCGNPNNFLSRTPCNNNGCTRCSQTSFCRQRNSRSVCQNGCCRVQDQPNTTQRPAPICGGREVSGGYCRAGNRCDSGFLCTSQNVCCRCAIGTSAGPCVNLQCPDNFRCNSNNECCPFQVGK